jgi:sensor histidine kinase YesM
VGFSILRHVFSITLNPRGGDLLQAIALCASFSAVIGYFFYSRAQLRVNRELIQQERITRLSSEKGALEANLRLLQAQIEPHFLFNTLSNVLSLIDSDPAKSKSMLADLVRYLRTSLSRTLPAATTLEQEIDMIEAYLKIQKTRMGERLRFSIDVKDALRQQAFPPMLLQPLVENAVRHGLEPSVEGGAVTIAADEEGDMLKVTVSDTGCGFTAYEQGGVGIANVRERLRLLYGDKGRLLLEENRPHGVRATIEAPRNAL